MHLVVGVKTAVGRFRINVFQPTSYENASRSFLFNLKALGKAHGPHAQNDNKTAG